MAAFGSASCASNGTKETRSTEAVSSVLFTVDQRYLVVITSKYHYFFDIPDLLRATIRGSFHPYVRARFSDFTIDLNDSVRGSVTLFLTKDTPPEAARLALGVGFRQGPSEIESTVDLHGDRFKANDAQFSDQYRLNQTYRITVVAQGDPTRMSPVTEIAGKVCIYGILLVVAPQVLFSK